MIEFVLDRTGTLDVVHRDVSPVVNLDHWALREISKNRTLADRLTAALKARSGTLALSWLNLAEFRKVTIDETARQAEDFVEAILPQVFLMEIQPFAVIDQENKQLSGRLSTRPHEDTAFLNAFIRLKPTSPRLLTARGIFATQNRPGARTTDKLADTIMGRLEAMRNEYPVNQKI